jgi:CHAT domain-containing protein
LAEIAWRRGERDAAIAEMEQAAGEIEAYREKIGSLGSRERWFASALSPFQSLIRYAIELGQDQRAFAVFERMKARELLDLLEGGHVIGSEALTAEERDEEDRLRSRSAELNRRITGGAKELEAELEQSRLEYQSFEGRLFRVHPELRERRGRGEPITAREAQRMLAPDEVALLYTLGDETATLLAVTREGIRGYLLPTPAPIIRRRIELFNASIQAWSARFDRDRASDLFRAVIEPAREQLQGKRRICFVPDAELYAIPLQALIDPSSGSYLVESYSVYITPSLSALGALRWKGSRGRRDLLAVGDPQFGVPGGPVAMTLRGALGPLPFTRSEVEEIAQVYAPRARVLVGAAATETAFKTLAGDYGVLHLASHGSLDDGNPLYSSIAFSTPAPAEDDTTASSGPSGARGPTDDGFLEAWEVMELSLDADIVVLSACETARGTITRGEGINGLLRAFFVAGVPTVVASLWKVEDRSTALLMSEFHRRLRDGERPADALAAAERTLLDGEFLLRHPYYWAGFLLYGDSE